MKEELKRWLVDIDEENVVKKTSGGIKSYPLAVWLGGIASSSCCNLDKNTSDMQKYFTPYYIHISYVFETSEKFVANYAQITSNPSPPIIGPCTANPVYSACI